MGHTQYFTASSRNCRPNELLHLAERRQCGKDVVSLWNSERRAEFRQPRHREDDACGGECRGDSASACASACAFASCD